MFRRLLFANFKLLYRFSQRVRQRFTSCGMLILMVIPIAGVFGFDTRSTLSFQIFSVTLIFLITSMTYTLFFRGRYSIERSLPDYGTVGAPLYYACTVRNNNGKSKKGLILIDELKNHYPDVEEFSRVQDPLDKKRNLFDRFIGYPRLVNTMQKLRGGSINPVKIEYIAEYSEIDVNIVLNPERRGYLYFDRISLAHADPLGLFQAKKSFVKNDKLLILPKLIKTPRLDLHGKRTYQHGGINNASAVGDSQEFISLRDYRPGDPLRAIHWRSYAKRGEPVVKEYQDEFFIRYGLILDTYLGQLSNDLFEDAVTIAASFMTAQNNQDALLDLMFIGNNTYRFTSGRGLASTENILEILACIQPVYDSNIERIQHMIKQHVHECSALIFILLGFDDMRKELLRNISKLNLPIIALILTEKSHEYEDEIIGSVKIHYIYHDSLQTDINNIV